MTKEPKTFVFLRLVFDGNNKSFSLKKVFIDSFSLKDEFNKSTQEYGFHDFSGSAFVNIVYSIFRSTT